MWPDIKNKLNYHHQQQEHNNNNNNKAFMQGFPLGGGDVAYGTGMGKYFPQEMV